MPIRIIMLGDIVGRSGRVAVAQLIPALRERYRPDLILANAENAHNGTGITPDVYQKLRTAGVDGITLGDHWIKKQQIAETLEKQTDIIRPANLPQGAKGKGWMKLTIPAAPASTVTPPTSPASAASSTTAGTASTSESAGRNVYVITVLGRVFMNQPIDDPFATVERFLRELPERNAIVILEIHAEATSEKQAIGWQFNGRVSAVIGTHTHVQTADERILSVPGSPVRGGTAYISDLGMCGPQESILGRDIDKVLTHMLTAMPAPFDVAEGDPRICGVCIDIDAETGRALAIERIEMKANPNAPPFTAPG